MERHVRSVYLYLFALLGLIFLSIGSVRLLDLGLRTFVFTEADAQERMRGMPPSPMFGRPGTLEGLAENQELSAEERAMIRQWLEEYERWQDEWEGVDMVRARREREAATSLAFILVGLPLWLGHWRRIRLDTRDRRPEDGTVA